MNSRYLQKVIDHGLVGVLLLFPISVNVAWVGVGLEAHPYFSTNLSVADVLIWLILPVWIVKIAIAREWRRVKWPPACIVAFVGFCFLSFVNAFSIAEWAKELFKLVEYFLVFYILLANNLQRVKEQVLIKAFFISTTAILLVAFVQHLFLGLDAEMVRGMFSNNNILGVFLCMAVPLVYAHLISPGNSLTRIWMAGMLILSIVVLLSGSALLSLIIGTLAMTLAAHKKGLLVRYGLTILIAGILYPWVIPDRNTKAVRDFASVYEKGNISKAYYHRIQILAINNQDVLVRKDFGGKFFRISGEPYFKKIVFDPAKGDLYKELDKKKNVKSRYLEMEASLDLLSEHTSLGIGLGNFQNNIGKYYNGFPKVNTAQPNEDSGYFIIASTSGILGLAAFLWIFLAMLRECRVRYRGSTGPEKALYWGLLGSLIALLTENVFSYLLSSALLTPLIFLIYLSFKKSVHVDHRSQKPDL